MYTDDIVENKNIKKMGGRTIANMQQQQQLLFHGALIGQLARSSLVYKCSFFFGIGKSIHKQNMEGKWTV